jgi:L-ascorbate 6-phosphate lactonase
MNFIERLMKTKCAKDEAALVWLGQAGFLLKTADGRIILIDPYLSDYTNKALCAEHGQKFRRMCPAIFEPGEIKADILLCSHEHEDHLDMDAIPVLLKDNSLAAFTNIASKEKLKKAGLAAEPERFTVLKKNEPVKFDEFTLTPLDCDHGEYAPEALGFLLDFGFTSVYYSGDTSYTRARLAAAIEKKPVVSLLPINGAFGNLNAEEAAMFAADLHTRLCVPHHFWTFPAHVGPKGTPLDALEAFPKYAPGCVVNLATPGEVMMINSNGLRE